MKKEIPEDRKRTEKCAKRQNRGTDLSESPEWALLAPVTVLGGVEQKGKTIWISNWKKKETKQIQVIILTQRNKMLIQEYTY